MHGVLLYVSSIALARYKQDGRSRHSSYQQLAESQAHTMAPSSSVKQLVAVAVSAFLLAAASSRQQPVHLRLYMHDVMRGPGTTAIHLIHGVGPPHDVERGAYFGDTAAIDVVVTEEPDAGAWAVGRAQGTYMLASQHEEVLAVAVTVALTAGPTTAAPSPWPAASGSTRHGPAPARRRLPDVEDGRAGGVREVRDGGAGRAHVRAAGERRRWQLVVISSVAVD